MQAKLAFLYRDSNISETLINLKTFFPLLTFLFSLFQYKWIHLCGHSTIKPNCVACKIRWVLIKWLNSSYFNIVLISGMLTRTVEYACDASQFSNDQSYLLVTSGMFYKENHPLSNQCKENPILLWLKFSFFAGGVSLSDEASDEKLIKGLYHVEGDSTGLVRNPVPQVKNFYKSWTSEL